VAFLGPVALAVPLAAEMLRKAFACAEVQVAVLVSLL
jgi:hypothetical protein